VPDAINPCKLHQQRASADPIVDLSLREAGVEQLPPADDSMGAAG
jgi:hypothetical protein